MFFLNGEASSMSLPETGDLGFLGSVYHAYVYGLMRASSKLMGSGQVILFRDYAQSVQELLANAGGDYARLLTNTKTFSSILKERQLADIRVESLAEGKVRLIVDKCISAPSVHPTLRVTGSKDNVCPLAAMGMVALANERGFKVGDSIFDYVKFAGSLSYLTENGSETEFILQK
jgi:hypothetical protein